MIVNKFVLFRKSQLLEIIDPVHQVVFARANKDDWLYFAASSVEERMWIQKLTDEKERISSGKDIVFYNVDEVPEEIRMLVLLVDT